MAVHVCPDCDSSRVRPSWTRERRSDGWWYCSECDGHFDELDQRERDHRASPTAGSADVEALVDASPDEMGGGRRVH